MDKNEQQIIDGLFDKLQQAERGSGPRDAEAEQRIAGHVGRQPGAPYYMAQAIVVQEHALQAAQQRIQQLEQDLQQRPAGGGGFLGGLFGGGSIPPARASASPQLSQLARYQQGGGGGFLAGAMETAMGVAGGLLLGNLLMSAFSGGEAAAAEDTSAQEEDPGMDDMAGMDEGLLIRRGAQRHRPTAQALRLSAILTANHDLREIR